MGECGSLLCLQEKRYVRKELASWYKKVPYAIGLELVADNLAGSSSGHIKTLLLPFNDMEPEKVVDFKPPSDTVCCVCDGKSIDHEQENIPILPTSSGLNQPNSEQHDTAKLNRSGLVAAGRVGEASLGHTEMTAASSTAAAAGEIPTSLEGLSNFYNQLAMTSILYQQQQQIHSAAVQAALQQAGTSANPAASDIITSPHRNTISAGAALKEPSLDLSSLSAQQLLNDHHHLPSTASATEATSSAAAGGLKVPEIRSKKKKDCNQKKTYTERELKAAVDAIRTRTLGTRKAAQMYGVPRSTLRNKMLKETEMSRQLPEGFLQFSRAAAYIDDSRGDTVHSDRNSDHSSTPGSKQASPLGSRKHTDNQTNPLELAASMQHNNAFLKQLEEMRNRQGINEQLNMLNQNRIFGDMFNPLQFAAAYPFFMPQYSAALAGMPSMDFMNPYTSSLMMPYLPEIMKNLHAQQKQERPSHMTSNGTMPSRHMKTPSESGSRPASVKTEREDIKVPAYKPTGANHSIDDLAAQLPLLSKSAKPVLSEENMDTPSHISSPFSAVNYLQHIIPRPELAGNKRSSPPSHHIPNKKYRLDQHSPLESTLQHSRPSNGSGATTGKKRPKRGQYRKYDSELLAQAVRAVQRGEMSVHRAGTFFGVPHSTLEYKVKERHLLRKKKIAESNENKSSSPNQNADKPSVSSVKTTAVSESSNSSHLSESKIPQASPPPSSQQSLAIDESRPFGASENNTPSAFFDFSSAYNLNTPASDILRKLHARAHQKANEIINGAKQAQESNS